MKIPNKKIPVQTPFKIKERTGHYAGAISVVLANIAFNSAQAQKLIYQNEAESLHAPILSTNPSSITIMDESAKQVSETAIKSYANDINFELEKILNNLQQIDFQPDKPEDDHINLAEITANDTIKDTAMVTSSAPMTMAIHPSAYDMTNESDGIFTPLLLTIASFLAATTTGIISTYGGSRDTSDDTSTEPPPPFNLNNKSIQEGASYHLQLPASDSYGDLAYQVISYDQANVAYEINGNNITIHGNDDSLHAFSITATNQVNLSTTEDFTLSVINSPPTVKEVADQTLVAGEKISIILTAIDVPSDQVKFYFSTENHNINIQLINDIDNHTAELLIQSMQPIIDTVANIKVHAQDDDNGISNIVYFTITLKADNVLAPIEDNLTVDVTQENTPLENISMTTPIFNELSENESPEPVTEPTEPAVIPVVETTAPDATTPNESENETETNTAVSNEIPEPVTEPAATPVVATTVPDESETNAAVSNETLAPVTEPAATPVVETTVPDESETNAAVSNETLAPITEPASTPVVETTVPDESETSAAVSNETLAPVTEPAATPVVETTVPDESETNAAVSNETLAPVTEPAATPVVETTVPDESENNAAVSNETLAPVTEPAATPVVETTVPDESETNATEENTSPEPVVEPTEPAATPAVETTAPDTSTANELENETVTKSTESNVTPEPDAEPTEPAATPAKDTTAPEASPSKETSSVEAETATNNPAEKTTDAKAEDTASPATETTETKANETETNTAEPKQSNENTDPETSASNLESTRTETVNDNTANDNKEMIETTVIANQTPKISDEIVITETDLKDDQAKIQTDQPTNNDSRAETPIKQTTSETESDDEGLF